MKKLILFLLFLFLTQGFAKTQFVDCDKYAKPNWKYLNEITPYACILDERDNQVYKIVRIRSQIWMAENLNYKTPSSTCYNDIETNCVWLGRLYEYGEALNACPEGFHLPNFDEFMTLFEVTDAFESSTAAVLRGSKTWTNSDENRNTLGFTVLPAGGYLLIFFDGYKGLNTDAYFWTSVPSHRENEAFYERFNYLNDPALSEGSFANRLSVRCIKNSD